MRPKAKAPETDVDASATADNDSRRSGLLLANSQGILLTSKRLV